MEVVDDGSCYPPEVGDVKVLEKDMGQGFKEWCFSGKGKVVPDEGEKEGDFLPQSTSFFNGNGDELVSLSLGYL